MLTWKRVAPGIYESGQWIIENHKTFLNPRAGWAIYHSRVFMGRGHTFTEAKRLVNYTLKGTYND